MSILSNQYIAIRTLSGNESPSLVCAKWLDNIRKNPDQTFKLLKFSQLPKRLGRFVWIECEGKNLTNLEKLIPAFLLSLSLSKKYVYLNVISCNFIKLYDRILFFDKVFSAMNSFFEKEAFSENSSTERGIGDIHSQMYTLLKQFKYEWAIREIDSSSIKKMYDVSWTHSIKMLCADTSYFTGVKEDKIEELWKSKKVKTNDRELQLRKDLMETGKSTNILKNEN